VTRESRGATVADVLARRLHVEVDRPLTHDQIVEARVGADRVRMCRSSRADRINLFLRSRSSTGRALDLAGASSAGTETRDDGRTQESRRASKTTRVSVLRDEAAVNADRKGLRARSNIRLNRRIGSSRKGRRPRLGISRGSAVGRVSHTVAGGVFVVG
jgi:hypothetical protein